MPNHKNINDIIVNAKEIMRLLRNNRKIKNELYQLQINDNKTPLSIFYPIETRWSSIIICIDRLLLLEKYIVVIIEKYSLTMTNSFWKRLKSLFHFLEPFKINTQNIQKDDATIYSCYENFNNIIKFYKSNNFDQEFKDHSEIIINLIEVKWNKHINKCIINASKLFNLDKKFKIDQNTVDFIIKWGTIYLTTYNITTEDNIKEILTLQINEFLTKENEFSFLENKTNDLRKACIIKNKKFSYKYVWGGYLTTHYELSKVAIAILSIYPTESCVERSFSIQSDVHSLDRNRLSDDLIEAEMNIKLNFN